MPIAPYLVYGDYKNYIYEYPEWQRIYSVRFSSLELAKKHLLRFREAPWIHTPEAFNSENFEYESGIVYQQGEELNDAVPW